MCELVNDMGVLHAFMMMMMMMMTMFIYDRDTEYKVGAFFHLLGQ